MGQRRVGHGRSCWLEEFCAVFKAKLWCLEMSISVNFVEVLEGIGCFGFWDVVLNVHVKLERIWH